MSCSRASFFHGGNRQHPIVQGRRRWEPSDLQNFLFVERLPRQQRFRKRIKLLAVLGQKAFGLLMALPDNSLHFRVDRFRRKYAAAAKK